MREWQSGADDWLSGALRAALDALAPLIAVLDPSGTIIAVNAAWRRAAALGEPPAAAGYVGASYFGLAELVSSEPGTAAALAEGVRQVLGGRRDAFRIEACWHGHQWFVVTAAPVLGVEPTAVLVSHESIAHRKRTEEALRQAEAKYRGIFENAIEGIFQSSADGRYLSANPSLARMYGYASPDELARELTDIGGRLYVDPGRRAEFARLLQEHDTVSRFESAIYRRDGSVIWISENARAVRDGEGALLYYEGTVEDITELKDAEAALEASRRQLQAEAEISAALARVGREMISTLDQPELLDRLCQLTTEVFGCDCSHTWLWKPEQEAYVPVSGWGDSSEQWESMRLLSLSSDVVGSLLEHLSLEGVVQLVNADEPAHTPARAAAQYGITVSLFVGLRRGADVIGFHSLGYRGRTQPFGPLHERIASGIAQLASMALEHARLFEELERASRLKSDFVATMSHELRTPLNVIMGYNELLLDGDFGPLDEAQRDPLRRVEKNARQLHQMIDATLDLSRLDQGQLPIDLRPVAFGDLLDEIAAEMGEERAAKPDVSFEVEIASNLPPLMTDRLKLKVVLKNLISNALKFTARGRVRITARPSGDGIECIVQDTGIGISAAALEFVFEPFRQADGSISPRYGGVGLGLHIVRRLLDRLGGTVAVTSQLGQGTTFRIWMRGMGPRFPH